ncbi:MAG: redoxin domain-containing protein, partial [Limisphaerales bacterium]
MKSLTARVMHTLLHQLGRLLLSAALLTALGTDVIRAQPANDMFANRSVISGTNIVVVGSNVGATMENGEPYWAAERGGASVWWSWTAPSNGTATISTFGSGFDTLLGVYTGTSASALTTIASNDDNPDTSDLTSKVAFDAVANETYQIAVGGFDGASGNIRLSVVMTFPPVNDTFFKRTVIAGTNIIVTASNVDATKEPGEPYHAGNRGGSSVWWSWRAPRSESATISTFGSSFDTLLGVYTGNSVWGLTTIASNDDAPDTTDYTSKVVFDTVANETYQIAVDGYDGASGSICLSVVVGPPPPPPPAPAWALPDLQGTMIYSTNFAGKVVILDFWATWCSPCKAELPDLVALQDLYGADGLVVVGADVSWSGESVQTVLDFLATWTPTVNYPIVWSNAGTEAPFGGIGSI